MICVDNTFLGLLLHPASRGPNDPSTGQPIDRLAERLDDLTDRWIADREKVIIPTPVLAEFLVLAADEGPQFIEGIHSTSYFQVKAFDERAAVELAAIQLSEGSSNREKKRLKKESKTKVKFDRQIVAIAKVNKASTIYSDDEGVATFAAMCGIVVINTWTLPPPIAKQIPFQFENTENQDEGKTAKIVSIGVRGSAGIDAENKTGTAGFKERDEIITDNP